MNLPNWTMASKTKPELYRLGGGWRVLAANGREHRSFDDYDSALAEFERQVELYRKPERRRLLAWISPGGDVKFEPEGRELGWRRAPWLDEPDDEEREGEQ